MREQLRRLLQLPPSTGNNLFDPSQPPHVQSRIRAAKELELSIDAYMRRACDSFDLSKNVEVSCMECSRKRAMASARRPSRRAF